MDKVSIRLILQGSFEANGKTGNISIMPLIHMKPEAIKMMSIATFAKAIQDNIEAAPDGLPLVYTKLAAAIKTSLVEEPEQTEEQEENKVTN